MRTAPCDTVDRLDLQHIWDRMHQKKPLCPQPQSGLVAFCDFLQRILPPGSPVRDLGCGRGRNATLVAQGGFAVHGCDISPAALTAATAQAQKAGTAGSHVVADLIRLPYPDDRFPAAVCVHVLPCFLKAESEKVVAEIRRVLRPGGWLYLDVLDCGDVEYGCGPAIEAHTFRDSDGIPTRFCSRKEVNGMLGGFDLGRVTRLEIVGQAGLRVSWIAWAEKHVGASRSGAGE